MSHTLAGLHCIRVNFKRVYSNISQKPVAVLQERGGGGGGGGYASPNHPGGRSGLAGGLAAHRSRQSKDGYKKNFSNSREVY